jgi:hypothetical protein
MFAYLSDDLPVAAEGETHFPELQTLKVRPRRRAAVLWFNTLPNGAEDERLLHGGLHVVGNVTKLAMNVWLRDPVLVGPLIPCSESLAEGKAEGKAGSGTA